MMMGLPEGSGRNFINISLYRVRSTEYVMVDTVHNPGGDDNTGDGAENRHLVIFFVFPFDDRNWRNNQLVSTEYSVQRTTVVMP
jgi:hypothetical protein